MKIDTHKDFYNQEEKSSMVVPDINIEEFELELFKHFKIKKEDIKKTIHLNIPDDLQAINEVLKTHGSIFAFWGMVYKYSYRKAKQAEERLLEYQSLKRKKCINLIEEERSARKSKAKQVTKADIDDKFLELYGQGEKYLHLKNRMVKLKYQRDRLEVLYEVMRQRKDIIVTLSNNLRQIEGWQVDRIKNKSKE
jgi:hypothetical protein